VAVVEGVSFRRHTAVWAFTDSFQAGAVFFAVDQGCVPDEYGGFALRRQLFAAVGCLRLAVAALSVDSVHGQDDGENGQRKVVQHG